MATTKEKADIENQKAYALAVRAQVMISVSGFNQEDYDLTGDSEALAVVIDSIDKAQYDQEEARLTEIKKIADEASAIADNLISEAKEKAGAIVREALDESKTLIDKVKEKADETVSLESEIDEVEKIPKPTLAELTQSSRKVYIKANESDEDKEK